jgi:hypothetical protein
MAIDFTGDWNCYANGPTHVRVELVLNQEPDAYWKQTINRFLADHEWNGQQLVGRVDFRGAMLTFGVALANLAAALGDVNMTLAKTNVETGEAQRAANSIATEANAIIDAFFEHRLLD